MICSHCGQQNPDNYQFCASCGARLANVSPAGPAASPRVQQPAPNSLRIQPVDRPPSPARSAPATRDVSYLLEDDDPKASRVAPVIVVLSLLALGAFAWWELRPMLQTGGVTPAKPPLKALLISAPHRRQPHQRQPRRLRPLRSPRVRLRRMEHLQPLTLKAKPRIPRPLKPTNLETKKFRQRLRLKKPASKSPRARPRYRGLPTIQWPQLYPRVPQSLWRTSPSQNRSLGRLPRSL